METKEEQLLKKKIRMLKLPCPECGAKNRVIDAILMKDRFGLNLFSHCGKDGDYNKIRTIKGILKN